MKLGRGIEAGLDRFCYNLVFKYGRIIRTVQSYTIREPGREIGADLETFCSFRPSNTDVLYEPYNIIRPV